MPRARSTMNQREFDIEGFPEETPKILNLADTYSSDYGDDEPTVKVQVPTFNPRIVLEIDTVEDDEDTLIMSRPPVETRYPGIGLTMAVLFGVAVWFLPLYYITINWILK